MQVWFEFLSLAKSNLTATATTFLPPHPSPFSSPMMRLILLLCAGRAAAFKSFSYKRDTAASALRELADKFPPVERSCYERAAVSDAVAAVFGVPSGTKVPMNTRLDRLESTTTRTSRPGFGRGHRARPGLYLVSGPLSYFVPGAETKAGSGPKSSRASRSRTTTTGTPIASTPPRTPAANHRALGHDRWRPHGRGRRPQTIPACPDVALNEGPTTDSTEDAVPPPGRSAGAPSRPSA